MNSLYKVGDRVLIKDKHDPGCDSYSYTFCFTEQMLTEHGGKVCTISMVQRESIHRANDIPDDNYLYRLVEDNEKWSWASSMFEPEF